MKRTILKPGEKATFPETCKRIGHVFQCLRCGDAPKPPTMDQIKEAIEESMEDQRVLVAVANARQQYQQELLKALEGMKISEDNATRVIFPVERNVYNQALDDIKALLEGERKV